MKEIFVSKRTIEPWFLTRINVVEAQALLDWQEIPWLKLAQALSTLKPGPESVMFPRSKLKIPDWTGIFGIHRSFYFLFLFPFFYYFFELRNQLACQDRSTRLLSSDNLRGIFWTGDPRIAGPAMVESVLLRRDKHDPAQVETTASTALPIRPVLAKAA